MFFVFVVYVILHCSLSIVCFGFVVARGDPNMLVVVIVGDLNIQPIIFQTCI